MGVPRGGKGVWGERGPECAKFEALFVAQYARLVRGLSVMLGDAEAAADAAQDAFVQAHRHWEQVGSYEDRAAWLWRVALNRASNERRRRRRQAAAVQRLSPVPGAFDHVPDVDLARQVASLPPGQRTVVSLFYVADHSVAEISRLLGVTEGTVKSQLHDGRNRLRVALEVKEEPRGR